MKHVVEDGRERTRLETWGEVAQHLGVEVRTAQRWERKLALPVRRLQGSQAVYAYVDEIETWRSSRESAVTNAVGERTLSPRWYYAAIGGVLVVVLAIAMRTRPITLEPVALSLESRAVVALDVKGNPLWKHEFDDRVIPIQIGNRSSLGQWWHRLDIDGNGQDEIIAIVAQATGDGDPRERLYCLSLDGRLRFMYEPALSVAFSERTFAGPWMFMDVEPVAADHSLWIALATSPWWPGVVVRLDPAGRDEIRYTQPGNVRVLKAFRDGNEPRVLAAGVNNEFAAASVALIDPRQPASRAPSDGGRYACRDCPAGSPLRYLLIDPSPLSKADGQPYNRFDSVIVAGQITAQTYEAGPESGVIYELSPDLKIVSATPTDTYWTWTPAHLSRNDWLAQVHRPQAVATRAWSNGGWLPGTVALQTTDAPVH